MDVKVGDYFVCEWGYDQTNLDHLVVVGLSKSGKTAVCRMTQGIKLIDAGGEDGLTPGCAYGHTFKLRVRPTCLVGSYPYIPSRPDALRKGGWFFPVRFGQIHFETKAEFGH